MSWFAVSQMECKSTETKECCVSAQSFHSGVHALLHEKYKKRLEMFATCESPIISRLLEGLASHVWMLPTSDSSSCRLSSEQACHALWSAIHLDRFQHIHIAHIALPDSRLPSKCLGTLPLATYIRKQTRKQYVLVRSCQCVTMVGSFQSLQQHPTKFHCTSPSALFAKQQLLSKLHLALKLFIELPPKLGSDKKMLPKDATNSEHVQKKWQWCKQKSSSRSLQIWI